MLSSSDAGVQVKEVKELVDILEDERLKHAERYRRQPLVARPWTVDSLAAELFDEEWSQQTEVEAAALSSFNGPVPSLAVLASPAGLCSVYLDTADFRAGTHLHALLVSYWSHALPAVVAALDAAPLSLLLSLRALSTAAHASLAPALRDSLHALGPTLDMRIADQHKLVLRQLLVHSEEYADSGMKLSVHQAELVERVRSFVDLPLAVSSRCFASVNGCTLAAATWEAISRPSSATVPTIAWQTLASLVSSTTPITLTRIALAVPFLTSTSFPLAMSGCVGSVCLLAPFVAAVGCVAPLAERRTG